MSTKFSRKPPLTKSPIRIRPTRAVRSSTSFLVQTPPGSMRKSAVLARGQSAKKLDIKPEIDSFSYDMGALAQIVTGKNETGGKQSGLGLSPFGANNSPLFERGRFYDLYSAKRNERLKLKLRIEIEDDNLKKCCGKYDLGVTAGTMKRRDSKRLDSGRKSLSVDLRSQPRRYFYEAVRIIQTHF